MAALHHVSRVLHLSLRLNSTKRKIPYTFVRGNSDWLNKPVIKVRSQRGGHGKSSSVCVRGNSACTGSRRRVHTVPCASTCRLSSQTAPGVWGKENTEFDFPFAIGYAYAIATYSAGILSFYQTRCNALVAAGTLPKSTSCSFTVAYP